MPHAISGITGTGTRQDPYLYHSFAELQTIVADTGEVDSEVNIAQANDIVTDTWYTLNLSKYKSVHIYLDNHKLEVNSSSLMFRCEQTTYNYIYFKSGYLCSAGRVMEYTLSSGYLTHCSFSDMQILCTRIDYGTAFKNVQFQRCGITLYTFTVLTAPVILYEFVDTNTTKRSLLSTCNINVTAPNLNNYPVIKVVDGLNYNSISNCNITGRLRCNENKIPRALFAYGMICDNCVIDLDTAPIAGEALIILTKNENAQYGYTSSGIYNSTSAGRHYISDGVSPGYKVRGFTYVEMTTYNTIIPYLSKMQYLRDSETPPPASTTLRWGMYNDEMPFLLDGIDAPEFPPVADPYEVKLWFMENGAPPYMYDFPTMIEFPPPFPHLYIGDDPVDKVYRGNTQITDIYVGSTKL